MISNLNEANLILNIVALLEKSYLQILSQVEINLSFWVQTMLEAAVFAVL